MKMKDKTKKGLVVGVSLALSVALIALIGNELRKAPADDVEIAPNSSQSTDIVVDEPDITEKEDVVKPNPIEPTKTDDDQSNNGDDIGTEQTIQPDPVKPEYTEEELTNPTKTPDGQEVEPTDIPEEEYEKETPPDVKPTPVDPIQPTNPSGGLPGFDNVPNLGENQQEHLDDMYENGNKIGIMD